MSIFPSLNDYVICELPNDVPTLKCRAIICDVCVTETNPEYETGNIDIAFIVLCPTFEEPFVYEKHFTNWSIHGGIEAAFECLINDSLADSFYDLIGTVFDAEITYHAYKNKIHAELELQEMILPPPTLKN